MADGERQPKSVTTISRLLRVVAISGHTTLVIDDVAVDHNLREFCGFGLNSLVQLSTPDSPSADATSRPA